MKQLSAILFTVLSTTIVAGQSSSFSVSGWWDSPSAPFSPVVEQNDAILFRVKAPAASKVALLFVCNVPGGHEWRVWRQELERFMQYLFK